jgi:MoaA/NifB/PqqE/SkfB family radical SAM enzyme
VKGWQRLDTVHTREWTEIKSYFDKTCLMLSEQAEIVTGPIQIGFDVTNCCMMRCLHCFNRSKSLKRNEMDDRQALHAFDEIIRIKPHQMCICGGEPLMRLETVMEGARNVKNAGIFLGMVSNGFLFDQQVAEKCGEIGFDQLQISLDGFRDSHERLRGTKGAFDRAVDAIRFLSAVGLKVVTSFTPTRFNIEEFEPYSDFVRSIGVREIRIQPLMLMGEAFFNTDIFPTDDQYRKLVRMIKQLNFDNFCQPKNDLIKTNQMRSSESDDFHIMWGDPVDHIIRFSGHISKPTFTFQIYSTGKIGVSPYFPITVGDINHYGLKDYWEAGLNKIWETELIQESARRIRGIETLGNALPPVYFSDGIDIDIIDDSPEEIKEKTKAFLGLSRGYSPMSSSAGLI